MAELTQAEKNQLFNSVTGPSTQPSAPKIPSQDEIFDQIIAQETPEAPPEPTPAAVIPPQPTTTPLQVPAAIPGGPGAALIDDPIQAAIENGEITDVPVLELLGRAADDIAATDFTSSLGKGVSLSPSFQLAEAATSPEAVERGLLGGFGARKRDFKPKTLTGELLSQAVPFVDPTSLLTGKVAQALPFIPAVSKSRLFLKQAQVSAARLAALSAGEQLAVTGAQQINAGEFDPAALLEEVATTAFVGGGIGGILGPFAAAFGRGRKFRNLKVKREKTGLKRRARALFEPETAQPLPETSKAKVEQVKKLGDRLNQVESLEARNKVKLQILDENPKALGLSKADIELQNARLSKVKESITGRAAELGESKAVQSFRESKKALQNVTVKVNGKDTPLVNQMFTKSSKFVPAEEVTELVRAPDITPGQRIGFTFKDFPRLIEQLDGSLRGPLKRLIVEPFSDGFARILDQKKEIESGVQQLFKPISKTYSKRKEILFDFAEGKSVNVTQDERAFMNGMAKTYSTLLQEINKTHAKLGLQLIPARKNYIPHLVELTDAMESGVEIGTKAFAKRTKTVFGPEKARLGLDPIVKDPLKALDAYLEPALKRIHLSEAADSVTARTKFLKPEIRKATEELIQSEIYGNKGSVDRFIFQGPLRKGAEVAENLTNRVTRSIISNSFNVVMQQASQIIPTAIQTGPKYALRGLAKSFKTPPESLMKLSKFLPQRSIKREFKSIALSGKLNKNPLAVMTDIVEQADVMVARQTWYSAFMHGTEVLGLSTEAAVRAADDLGRRLHAQYQNLYRTKLLRSRTGKVLFPFQTFVANQANFLMSDTKLLASLKNTSQTKEVLKVMGGMLATAQVYHMLGFRGPSGNIAPTQVSQDFLGAEGLGAKASVVKDVALEAAQNIPLIGTLAFPGSNLLFSNPAFAFLAGEADPLLDKEFIRGNSAMQELYEAYFTNDSQERTRRGARFLKKGPLKFVPSGRQIGNVIEGLDAARTGFYKIGTEEVPLDNIDKFFGILFGPSQSPSARKFFREQDQEKRNRERDE